MSQPEIESFILSELEIYILAEALRNVKIKHLKTIMIRGMWANINDEDISTLLNRVDWLVGKLNDSFIKNAKEKKN